MQTVMSECEAMVYEASILIAREMMQTGQEYSVQSIH
jgi:hypothetical protein